MTDKIIGLVLVCVAFAVTKSGRRFTQARESFMSDLIHERRRAMTFEDMILNIVQENSGGVKMTKLIADVFVLLERLSKAEAPKEFDNLPILGKESGEFTSPFLDVLDCKLEEMEAAGKIGLLRYGWDMGGGVRAKTFIYCPIGDSK